MISRTPILLALWIHGLAILALAAVCAGAHAAAFPAALTEEVGVQLGRLSSPSAAERAGAQRWLSAHLGTGDLAAVAAAAHTGGAEVRARLVEALSEEDRLIGLSAALAAAREADSATLGKEALVEAVERWSAGSKKAGMGQAALFEALRKQHDRTIQVDAPLSVAPLEHVLDLIESSLFEIDRVHALAIAIDPRCAPVQLKPRSAEGRLDGVLSDLVARRGLACRGYGFGDDEPDGAAPAIGVPLILVVPREAAESSGTAAQLLAQWMVAVASAGDAPARAAAARALAASGWPAAVAWLADRWSTQDDAAALEGVLLAARRGHVAPALLRPAAQERLRAEMERALASGGGERAIAIATALGATGTIGSRGEDLLAPALNGLAGLTGRALYARLVELEERHPAGEETVAALRALLTRTDVDPASAWLALVTLSRAGGTPETIARTQDLVAWCAARDHLDELGRIVRGQPSFPPEAWRDPHGVPEALGPRAHALVASAWLARGDVDAAAAHVENALQVGDPRARETFALALRSMAKDLGPAPFQVVFARALASAAGEPGAALRAAAIAGLARTDDLVARVLSDVPQPAVARADALALAALVAGPRGEEARTRLLAALRGQIEADDAVAAADRAVAELRAARDEPLERAFIREARAAAREGRPELRTRLRIDSWPAPPPGEPLRVADLDRSFERAGLP